MLVLVEQSILLILLYFSAYFHRYLGSSASLPNLIFRLLRSFMEKSNLRPLQST